MKIKEVAITYIKSLTSAERKKLRIMVDHNVMCGADYARKNKIEPFLLNEELKSIFSGGIV